MNKILKILLIIITFIYFACPVQASGDKIHHLYLLTGRSELLKFENEIVRTSIADTGIADVVVVSPKELLVNAKASGSTSLVVWDKEERSIVYDVTVGIDTTRLKILLKEMAPEEDINVITKDDTVVLQGEVEKQHTINNINEVAKTFSEKVVNIMHVKEPQQIMLKVRFAEVNRSAAKDLGFDFLTGDSGHFTFMSIPNNMITDFESNAISGTYEASATAMENLLQIRSGDFFFDWLFDNLEKKGLLRILAEPNLVTIDGKEANFLAGGEFPIPIVYGTGGTTAVHVEFKEYGIKLNFTPHVTEADAIQLKVKPEVSILDHSAAAVKLSGFSIPALITRRTETTVELKKGESLVIGGLISNTATEANRKVAGLGDIPILGTLFQSKSFERNETELIVLVTPKIVEPMHMPEKKKLYPPEKVPELFQKEKAPYEEKQADEIREYLNPDLLEKAKTLEEIEKIERQKQLELRRAQEELKKSKKGQPKQNFTPKKKHNPSSKEQTESGLQKTAQEQAKTAEKLNIIERAILKKQKAIVKKESKLQIEERKLHRQAILNKLQEKENLKKTQEYLERQKVQIKKDRRLKARQKILERKIARTIKKEQYLNDTRAQLFAEERELAEKKKQLIKKEKSLLARQKFINEKEAIAELLIEINRRLVKHKFLARHHERLEEKAKIESDSVLLVEKSGRR